MNDTVNPAGETQLSEVATPSNDRDALYEMLGSDDEIVAESPDTEPNDDVEQSEEANSDEQTEQSQAAESDAVEWTDSKGKAHRLPKEAHDAMLRQDDYTRKTSEVANQKRDLDARDRVSAELAHIVRTQPQISNALASAQAELQALQSVNWTALQQQDPEAFNNTVARFNLANINLQNAQGAMNNALAHESDKRAQLLAHAQHEAKRELAGNGQFSIKGFNDKTLGEITSYWNKAGIPNEILQRASTAFEVSVLNDAMKYRTLMAQAPQKKQVGSMPVITPKAQPISINRNPQARAANLFMSKPTKDNLAMFLENE